jgi:hypothetical protein
LKASNYACKRLPLRETVTTKINLTDEVQLKADGL